MIHNFLFIFCQCSQNLPSYMSCSYKQHQIKLNLQKKILLPGTLFFFFVFFVFLFVPPSCLSCSVAVNCTMYIKYTTPCIPWVLLSSDHLFFCIFPLLKLCYICVLVGFKGANVISNFVFSILCKV